MKAKIKRFGRGDRAFPKLLKEIPGSPEKLFVRGELNGHPEKAVAIVGTRKASAVGLKIAEEWAHKLARAGLAVISGLALGIDSAAHKGALKAGGRTIAVLGCGVDNVYPAQNENLANEILSSGGAILSEYDLGMPTLPHQFIERNRIISGLALATIVIEAPIRSGALATAGFAGVQGRAVFVVPGPIHHPNYRGSHALIRDGATLVTSAEEILEELGFAPGTSAADGPEKNPVIMALEKTGRPMSIDEIIEKTGLGIGEAASEVGALLIAQKVVETPAGYALI